MYLKVGVYLDFVYGDGKFFLYYLMELFYQYIQVKSFYFFKIGILKCYIFLYFVLLIFI